MRVFSYVRVKQVPVKKPPVTDPLTQKVRQIERLLTEGMAAKDVAEFLGMKANTLGTFMRSHGIRKPKRNL